MRLLYGLGLIRDIFCSGQLIVGLNRPLSKNYEKRLLLVPQAQTTEGVLPAYGLEVGPGQLFSAAALTCVHHTQGSYFFKKKK